MATVNQVVRERRLVWRALKRQLKATDSALEKLERLQNRVLARKRKAPEIEDLQEAVTLHRALLTEFDRYSKILAAGYAT